MNDDSKGNYAAVNGLDLYYEIHGDGQPLILLHGVSGLSRCSETFYRCSRKADRSSP